MLVEFTVENFLSFKDEITFNMVAEKSIKDEHKNNVFSEPVASKFDLLKSAVIYGANASGKSNLLKSFAFMKEKVFTSFRDSLINIQEKKEINSFKLSTTTNDKRSKFEIIFIQNNKRYRYGFEIDNNKICSEWLYYVPEKREANLFNRTGNKFKINESFKEAKNLENKTRDDVLFLSVLAQFNGKISKEVIDWFKKVVYISALEGRFNIDYSIHRAKVDPVFKQRLLSVVQKLDVGIENFEINEVSVDEQLKGLPVKLKETILESFKDIDPKVKGIFASTIRNKYDDSNNIVE